MTKKTIDKWQDYREPFPLYDDPIFKKLTRAEQRFVYNIFLQPVTGWANWQCYKDAYGTKHQRSCYSCSTEVLKRPKIIHCVDLIKQAHAERLGSTAERVLEEISCLGFSDLTEYLDENGNLVANPKDLPARIRRAISSVDNVYDKNGNVVRWKISLWSKPEALKMLMNINGIGTTKKVELSGPGGGPIEHNVAGKIRMDLLSDTDIEALDKIVDKLSSGDDEE